MVRQVAGCLGVVVALAAWAGACRADPVPAAMQGVWAEPGGCGVAGRAMLQIGANALEYSDGSQRLGIRVDATPLADNKVKLTFISFTTAPPGKLQAGDSSILQVVGDELTPLESTVGGEREMSHGSKMQRCTPATPGVAPPGKGPIQPMVPSTPSPMPAALIGRWGSAAFCKPDGVVVTITTTTLTIVERGGSPVVLPVSASDAGGGLTRLTVAAGSPDGDIGPGDSMLLKQFGNQIQLMETVSKGVRTDESGSASLIRCSQ